MEQITPEIVLIKWDKFGEGPSPGGRMVLVSTARMLETTEVADDDEVPSWEFYETRAELDAFHEWLCAPSDKDDPPPKAKASTLKLIN